MSIDKRNKNYILVDGLRGIAAIAVVISHMPQVFPFLIIPNAWIAVDFFLQISGFVMAYAYSQRIAAGLSFRSFMTARIVRLYPVFLIGVIAGFFVIVLFIVLPSPPDERWGSVATLISVALPNLVMLPQVTLLEGGRLFPLNHPMWTIFIELIIYAAFFLSFSLFLRLRNVLAALVVTGLALIWVTAGNEFGAGYRWSNFGTGVLRLTASFLIGLAVFRLGQRWSLRSDPYALLVAAALTAVLLSPPDSQPLRIVAIFTIFPIILLAATSIEPASERLTAILRWLGQISYPLYVIHVPLYHFLYETGMVLAPDLLLASQPLPGIVMLALCLLAASQIARHYDGPARSVLRRLLTRPVKAEMARGSDGGSGR